MASMMRPMKLAILGGGPSAFYVAARLLQLLPPSHAHASLLKIHIYDRLWSPHGLVRYGVAPDHPEVKNCTHKFDLAAQDCRLQFFGNVNVSSTSSPISHTVNISADDLFPHYSHLLVASGCTAPRLHAALPPSDIVMPALSLVHWYTQHPSLPNPPPLEKTSHVTVIGNGNVSLDVARMLLTEPSHLAQYDVPQAVLSLLSRSSVRHVSIMGRRGPLEASFTNKELREMMNLSTTSMIPIDKTILTPAPGTILSRQQSRKLTLLQQGSKNAPGTTPKSWSLDFFRSPTGVSTPTNGSRGTLLLAHTALDNDCRAVPTGESSAISTDLVITSLGYTAEPAHAWHDPARGHARNAHGRLIGSTGRALRNMYASGWAATGARGVLASTLLNAHAVADAILTDHFSDAVSAGRVPLPAPESGFEEVLNPEPDMNSVPPAIASGLEAGDVTTYRDWALVDAEEIRRGQELRKERERMGWTEAKAFLRRCT